MGVASLILGIVSVTVGCIPLLGIVALVPAIVGLILGIIDLTGKNQKKEERGFSIAGTILSSIAIVIIIFLTLIFGVIVTVYMDDYLYDYLDTDVIDAINYSLVK